MSVLKPVLIFLVERLTVAGAGVAAALAAFLVLAHAVHGGETQRFDAEVFHFFQDRQEPIVHRLMLCVSLLASGWAISGVSLACLPVFWRKPARRWDALSLLLAAAGGQGVVYGLKALFHRARPEAVFASLGYSFPSGHAFAAVTLYGMLAYWLARGQERPRAVGVWGAGILLILLIGFSRIYLGVHYASDVAAGFAAGLPWLWGCLALPSRTQSPLRV
jgi:undecaprenyl-diphosphatase